MAERGGQIGNDNASRGKEFRAALQRVLAKRSGDGGWRAALEEVCKKLVAAAIDKEEAWAIQEIANRIDGKPAQALVVNGDEEGGPVRIQTIEIKAVDP